VSNSAAAVAIAIVVVVVGGGGVVFFGSHSCICFLNFFVFFIGIRVKDRRERESARRRREMKFLIRPLSRSASAGGSFLLENWFDGLFIVGFFFYEVSSRDNWEDLRFRIYERIILIYDYRCFCLSMLLITCTMVVECLDFPILASAERLINQSVNQSISHPRDGVNFFIITISFNLVSYFHSSKGSRWYRFYFI